MRDREKNVKTKGVSWRNPNRVCPEVQPYEAQGQLREGQRPAVVRVHSPEQLHERLQGAFGMMISSVRMCVYVLRVCVLAFSDPTHGL